MCRSLKPVIQIMLQISIQQIVSILPPISVWPQISVLLPTLVPYEISYSYGYWYCLKCRTVGDIRTAADVTTILDLRLLQISALSHILLNYEISVYNWISVGYYKLIDYHILMQLVKLVVLASVVLSELQSALGTKTITIDLLNKVNGVICRGPKL